MVKQDKPLRKIAAEPSKTEIQSGQNLPPESENPDLQNLQMKLQFNPKWSPITCELFSERLPSCCYF